MKTFFISLVVAILIYILGGMIVWNLVCSFAIDVPNLSITTLENYRLLTYSGLTGAIMLIDLFLYCIRNKPSDSGRSKLLGHSMECCTFYPRFNLQFRKYRNYDNDIFRL